MVVTSVTDKFIMELDQTLVTLFGRPRTTQRTYPADNPSDHLAREVSEIESDAALTQANKTHAARLMRINHVGEVCAQALYQSQALTARDKSTKAAMQKSAMEENDHLEWCEKRINELGGRKSLLNPLWYAGSFTLGSLAGIVGDQWSLGFVVETEKQVVQHLQDHLDQLSPHDIRSRAIIEQMKIDEGEHAVTAKHHGGASLPEPIQRAMSALSKVMTKTAYWV